MNKKLSSFVFGCILAASYLWLIGFASSVSFFDGLFIEWGFTLAHYTIAVTVCLAITIALITLLFMNKVFNLCTSEHPFWLVLPSFYLLALTTFSAFEMLIPMLYAAIPCLLVLGLSAVFNRSASPTATTPT